MKKEKKSSSEDALGIRCNCGGKLKESTSEVEFFGIDYGVKPATVCAKCGSEYISQDVMEEIEADVKSKGLFGLERRSRVTKSGNSLVIRIPKEIVQSLKIKPDLPVLIYPSEKRKLVIEVEENQSSHTVLGKSTRTIVQTCIQKLFIRTKYFSQQS